MREREKWFCTGEIERNEKTEWVGGGGKDGKKKWRNKKTRRTTRKGK